MTDLRPASPRERVRETGRSMQPSQRADEHPLDERPPAGDVDPAPVRAAPPHAPIPDADGGGSASSTKRLRVPRPVPAGHAIAVIVGALVLAMLFNSHAMVHAGEGMRAGTTRDLVLDVAKPVDSFAHTLYLDRPRKWLDSLFGHQPAPTGPSDLSRLPAKADSRPLGSGSGQAKNPSKPAQPKAGTPVPSKPSVKPFRVPTAAAPLKLLVAGDSMTEFLGPALINQGNATGKLNGNTITKYGTGLVRPDFFDWSIYAKQLIEAQNPEAVVVMMGGNDGQGITLADGTVLHDGTQEWAKEYRRRLEVVMRIFAGDGKRPVYWVPMPIPRSPQLAIDYHLMDLAVADAAAAVPGVVDVDIVNRLSNNGQYSDYLPGLSGQTILARARDGIHLSQDGASLAASLILHRLNQDWHLTP